MTRDALRGFLACVSAIVFAAACGVMCAVYVFGGQW